MEDIQSKLITRKQFIMYLGVILVSLFGITGYLNRINNLKNFDLNKLSIKDSSKGSRYGESPYGI